MKVFYSQKGNFRLRSWSTVPKALHESSSGPMTIFLIRKLVSRMLLHLEEGSADNFSRKEYVELDKTWLDFSSYATELKIHQIRAIQRGWLIYEGEGTVMEHFV